MPPPESLFISSVDREGLPYIANPKNYNRLSCKPQTANRKGKYYVCGKNSFYYCRAFAFDGTRLSAVSAYISAPSIGMSLPIYLGANDEMMGYGAAHLNNTSLPLNEKSTNCVVAGHTGYVGRIFFDNIRNLKKGDKVDVKNFWGTIHYKVVNFKKVEPNQTTDTVIQNGKKLLTLVTCTQLGNGKYGRYLVICEAK